MSLQFIHDFQVKIYQLLANNRGVSTQIDKIYLSVVQDAKYPFLLITILNVVNLSRFDQAIYEIDFEIAGFARDKNQGILTSLADKITAVLTMRNCAFQEYILAGLNMLEVKFARSQDLITTKLTINYKALIKKEV